MSNVPELPPPPKWSRATVKNNTDEFRILLPPVSFKRVMEQGSTAGLLFVLAMFFMPLGLVPLVTADEELGTFCAWCCSLPMGLMFSLSLILFVGRLFQRQECLITSDLLTIRTRIWATWETWSWGLREVEAVGAWNGLWVVARGYRCVLFQGRDEDETRWVAEVLREVLGARESVAPGPNDIEVMFRVLPSMEVAPGLLRTLSGEMTLSHGFADRPVYRFVAKRGGPLLPVQWVRSGGTATTGPDDLNCRPREPVGFELRIEPAGSQFVVEVWNDDPEELPRAIARLWGSH